MHENQILDPIFHQVLDPCLNTPKNYNKIKENSIPLYVKIMRDWWNYNGIKENSIPLPGILMG